MFPRIGAATVLILCGFANPAVAQEFRALWVDAFHAGLRNATETSAVIAAARTANCNAVVVEVRKRGDAYYLNGLEPVASDVVAGFDPLADLIQKGHSGTPRIEVHAWLVTYNIWNVQNTPPAQPTHPYNLHPDWLSTNDTGATWANGNYQLDQGHPAVQQHTFDVVMDIINRYDVDGVHFDYIRYSDDGSSLNRQPWGYNPVAVARYKKLKNVTATPAPTDGTWLQWRRDQVTALLRKVYLKAWARKPNVRISAALITYSNPPANLSLASWQSTEPYGRVLQDWRAWMEEGILDLACPMIYRNESTTPGFAGWANFAKDRQYNRAAAIGMGWYLNSIGNTISQVKQARMASAGGKSAVGIVGYSYAVPNKDNISQSVTWSAFTNDAAAEMYDPGGTPVFANGVPTPAMPWKTSTSKGHLMGTLREPRTGAAFDGASVVLSGPANRTVITDATGFFGSVDLPIGNYTLRVAIPGYRTLTQSFSVTGAMVTEPALRIEAVPLQIISLVRSFTPNALTITWNSIPGRTYRVEGSNDLQTWSTVATGLSANGPTTTYQWTLPPTFTQQAFVRVGEEL